MQEYLTHSEAETEQAGADFAEKIKKKMADGI